MLKEYFLGIVNNSIKDLVKNSELGQMKEDDEIFLNVEVPKNPDFGDFAVNVASLARYAKLAPNKIAELIANNINKTDFEINTTAGFINFKIKPCLFNQIIREIIEKKTEYGRNNSGNGEKVILEYAHHLYPHRS